MVVLDYDADININTGPNGAVVKSSANGLVCTGFASWYRFQLRVGSLRPKG